MYTHIYIYNLAGVVLPMVTRGEATGSMDAYIYLSISIYIYICIYINGYINIYLSIYTIYISISIYFCGRGLTDSDARRGDGLHIYIYIYIHLSISTYI